MMEASVDCMTPDWTKQPQIAQGKGQSFGMKAKGDVKRDLEPYAAKRHAQRLLSFLTVARAFFFLHFLNSQLKHPRPPFW